MLIGEGYFPLYQYSVGGVTKPKYPTVEANLSRHLDFGEIDPPPTLLPENNCNQFDKESYMYNYMYMNFEWDENKNQSNLIKHRLLFEDILTVFDSDNRLEYTDVRRDYGETRTVSICELIITLNTKSLIVVVVHTDREGRTRIISARKATKKEAQLYYNYINAA